MQITSPTLWLGALARRLVSSRCGAIALRPATVLLAAFTLLSGVAVAQAPASGSVAGRVQNVGNGRYLPNARVTVEGTSRETYTNEYGEYRFVDLPAGEVKVRVDYTGLDTETQAATIAPGQEAALDFNLTSRDRYGIEKTVVLDTFVVQSNREYEGNALATNDQRYARNIKIVVAANSFGDINEGNPGEFLKYLPGVTVDYVAADVRTVSVRGFPSNFTNVSWDGMRLTSSASGSSNRIFEFEQVSINNISRTEVVKVPMPENPADSLGGNINFISKNAFERKGAQFNYRAYLSANSEHLTFKRIHSHQSDPSFVILPSFDFDYTLPINDRLGIVITGLSSNQHVQQDRFQPTWNFAQAGATPSNPYLQQLQVQDGPKVTYRASFGAKVDYKLSSTQTLSVGAQKNYYLSSFGNRNLNFNVGTTATSSVTGGTGLLYGPTFVQSPTVAFNAASTNTVTQGGSFRDKYGDTRALILNYKWDTGDWNVDVGANTAVSKTWYRAMARGHFASVNTRLQNVAKVRADGIGLPAITWAAFDAAGTEINPNLLANHRITTATNDPIDGVATMQSAHLDAERHFDNFALPFSLKAGFDVREESRDNRRYSEIFTHVGADGLPNTADDVASTYLDAPYSAQEKPNFGQPAVQWVDPYRLYQAYVANPNYFTRNAVTEESFRRTNSERIDERISAAYFQIDGKLLANKLRYVAGVRYEKTQDRGEGVLSTPDAVWQRNSDGSYVDGNAGLAGIQRVRRADAGAVGSMEELNLIRTERGYKASRGYDGFYPSLHLTYDLTDKFLVRFAYAKTLGRPDYANIIPNSDINEDDNDPNAAGTITIRNTALRPWSANNYDLSFEYYSGKGGVVSAGVFKKTLKDFWEVRGGTVDAALADELGLSSRYVGWGVSTLVNGGSAAIDGAEFNVVQPLTMFPGFLRSFTLKANGTLIHVSGTNTSDFRGFISKAGNFSISYNKSPFVFNVNFNFRGRQKGTSISAPALQTGAQYGATNGFFEYFEPRYNIDLSGEYKLNKRLSVFASARNILNKEQVVQRYNAATPAYAQGFRHEEFGVNLTLGIKGSF